MDKGKPIVGTGRIDFNVTGDLRLFEINFIAEHTEKLQRQVRFGRWSFAVAIVMLLFAGWLVFGTVGMLQDTWEMRNGIVRRRSEIKEARQRREDLDKLRDEVAGKVKHLVPMVPIAGVRVPWAPKLAALSRRLPDRMGVSRVEISSGNLFSTAASGKQSSQSTSRSKASKKDIPAMHFTVIYEPLGGMSEDPIGRLLDNLRGDDDFMYKMDVADLEAAEAGTWQSRPVVFFRGIVKGASQQP